MPARPDRLVAGPRYESAIERCTLIDRRRLYLIRTPAFARGAAIEVPMTHTTDRGRALRSLPLAMLAAGSLIALMIQPAMAHSSPQADQLAFHVRVLEANVDGSDTDQIDALEALIDALEDQIDALEDQIDALEDADEAETPDTDGEVADADEADDDADEDEAEQDDSDEEADADADGDAHEVDDEGDDADEEDDSDDD